MNQKMKSDIRKKIVCTVINDLSTDQRMHRICDSLVDAGYHVTLIGRQLASSQKLTQKKFQQVRLKCIWNKGFLFYFEYNLLLTLWLIFHKVDIINAIDLDTIAPAWLVSKIKKVKTVYDAHEWFPYCPEIVNRPSVHKFWLEMEEIFLPKMDAIYTVSQSIANEFSKLYRREIGLVRNMPKIQSIDKTIQEKYILYQGALNIGRGLEELIDAMQDIDMELWIAGEGDIEQELKQKVNHQNLSHKVKFLGKIDPEKLWYYTENAWIGVNLLQNLGLNYYYSLANKFFDYVQAEIPQITMNFPEYQKMNQEFEVAILINDLNKDEIIKSVLKLNNDLDFYNHFKSQSLQAKVKWNWDIEKKTLIDIYERLSK
jgi:hypothetical protein